MNGYQISPSKSSKGSFDPESFKRELNRASVSVETLQLHRKKIQSEVDEISLKLKKNVFQNYSLFIDSAKEISLLKNEMYSLSKLLTDQQGLLSSLTDVSISGDRTHGLTLTEKKEVAAKFKSGNEDADVPVRSRAIPNPNASAKALVEAIERIDGGTGLLETRNRHLIHSGELTELDPNDYSRFSEGKVFAVLANDCLILSQSYQRNTTDSRSRNDRRKYKFTSMIELDNIAVVNVKDVNYKSAFKVLMASTTKVFECESIEGKKKWLDLFESAKKARRQSLNFQRRDSMLFSQMQEMNPNKDGAQTGFGTSGFGTSQPGLGHHQSAMSLRGGGQHLSPTVDRFPSFEEMEELSESESEFVPIWLQEVPDDMDVFIAQRKFDDAVDLVHKVNDHITMYPKCFDGFFHNDLRLQINHKIQELIDAVSCDLKVSPDRIQSDHKAACHAVWRLRRLGKNVLATKLFLDQRTSLLKFSLKNQMKDGATIKYVENLSKVLVHNLITSGNDFKNAFMVVPLSRSYGSGSGGNGIKSPSTSFPPAFPMSCFIRWSHQELSYFLNIFSKNVFTPQVPPSVSAQCVKILRDKVHVAKGPHPGIGLDLVFILDKSLKSDIERVIHDSSEKLIEAVKLRIKDDRWEGQDFKNKPALSKFLEEMKEVGLRSMEEYVHDEYKVSLTSGVTQFAKSYLNLTVDVLKLSTPFTSSAVIDALVKSFAAEMKYVEQVLKNLSRSNDHRVRFVRKNAQFILDHVVGITERMYQDKTGIPFRQLEEEKEHFVRILTDGRRMSDENRRHDDRRTSNDHGQNRRPSHQGSGTSTPSSSSSRSSPAITGNGNSSNKRSPSKSTISIGTDGKTVSTTTYL